MENTKPNIIFFMSDQQRWDTLGCYGQKLEVTPNLDRMASLGIRFEHAFTCQPVCGPARACIQTGKYATEVGCHTNNLALPLNEKTIAHWFSDAGYDLAYIGKWHLASTGVEYGYPAGYENSDFSVRAVPPERRGGWKDYWLASDLLEYTSDGYSGHMFDRDMNRVDFNGYRADCITDFALDYLRRHNAGETGNRDKPFVLFLSYIEPHHQNNHNRYEGPPGSKERFGGFETPADLKGTGGDWRENYPDYLGCCRSLDENLGRLCDLLKQQGLEENTIIFYTSDHGSHFRTRNGEYKRSCHEASIRIPMVAYGPGFKGGKVITELVSLIDVPPTLLACGGIENPEAMKGRPLQQLVEGTAYDWPEEVFLQISEDHMGRAIRTRKWKYSVRAEGKDSWDACSDTYTEDYLYDLENDYVEKNNLVSDPAYADIRREMAERLKKRMAEAGEPVPVILPKV